MAKWRLWQDEYLGMEWNNRREVSSPEFTGAEIDDDKIEQELLSHYAEGVRGLVEIDGDDTHLYATLTVCGECDVPWPCKAHGVAEACEDTPITMIGYHAERVRVVLDLNELKTELFLIAKCPKNNHNECEPVDCDDCYRRIDAILDTFEELRRAGGHSDQS